MSESTRRAILSCLVIIVVACLCAGILGVVEIGIFNAKPGTPLSQIAPTGQPSSIQQTLPPPASPTPPQDSPSETPQTISPEAKPTLEKTPLLATDALPAEISAEMDQIQEQVVQIRGLQPQSPINRALLSQDELKERVKDELLSDYTQQDAQKDVTFFSSLGLLDPELDFYKFYQDLLGEQVAGYYDDKTKEMYVIQEAGFNGTERFTYAHEYDHALQDQNYNLEKGLNLEDAQCKLEEDRCEAGQALVEGDATIASLNWLSRFGTKKDIQDILGSTDIDTPIFNNAPSFLQKDFLFPYQQGQVFVQSLFDHGGWQAVNQAFQKPPLSTEQILHPSRYPDDQPIDVTLPDMETALGSGWQIVKETTLGEWYTYLLLADGRDNRWRLDDTNAQRAAEGWGGDNCYVYTNNHNQTVFVLRTIWDNPTEASQFATAFQDYAARRFNNQAQDRAGVKTWQGQSEYSMFQLDGDQTTWVIAPDRATAETAWQMLQQ